MTSAVLNLAIGEARKQPHIWMEGLALERAGIRIGARYALDTQAANLLEFREVSGEHQGMTFLVSRRTRRGAERPLIEIRGEVLRKVFDRIERVRVAISGGRIVITASHVEVNAAERTRRLLGKLSTDEALSVASLFHGGGVLDKALHHGLQRSGVDSFLKVAVELEPHFLESSLRNNVELWRPESVAICSDVRQVEFRRLPACDVLVGGVPCTGASLAGRAKNHLSHAEEHSAAGALFVDYLEAVRALNPAVAVLENVPEYANTASMMVIRSVLASLGYRLWEAILDGNTYGALERRRRLVMVAITARLDAAFDFERVTPVREKEAALRDVLEAVPLDSPRWKTFEGLAAKADRDKAAGKGFSRQLLTGAEGHCGTIGKGYAKTRSTEPFIVHPENPALSRIMTPLEHARVKGIPESVAAGESDTVAHEIYGQSVIYPKFEAVFKALGQVLREAAERCTVTGAREVAA